MDSTGKQLLNLLFNPGESVCVSPNPYSYHSISLESAMDGTISLVPPDSGRPTQYCDSSELILCSINPISGFRKDSNVQRYRTFLWEIDTGSIKEQLNTFKHLDIPISAQIFSGNKSIHSTTVLDSDELDEKTYRLLYQWALAIMPICDANCKNPSRSVRIPGAYRAEGKQRLVSLNKRIPLSDFLTWLNRYPHLRPKAKEKKLIPHGDPDFSRLAPWCKKMLKDGILYNKGRNQTWFSIFYEFALCGFTQEQAEGILSTKFSPEHDFDEKEWLTCASSAYKIVSEGRHG